MKNSKWSISKFLISGKIITSKTSNGTFNFSRPGITCVVEYCDYFQRAVHFFFECSICRRHNLALRNFPGLESEMTECIKQRFADEEQKDDIVLQGALKPVFQRGARSLLRGKICFSRTKDVSKRACTSSEGHYAFTALPCNCRARRVLRVRA